MSRRFAVVHEARADFEGATELADRVFVESIDWMEEGFLDSNRAWISDDSGGEPLTWKSIANRARDFGIRVRGHFNNEPGMPDARAARRALTYVRLQCGPIDAVLLIRDMDDQPERRVGLEQARDAHTGSEQVVIGVADPKRECWALSGFDPEDEPERERLDAQRQALGFNPCSESHQLIAKAPKAKRNAKEVLETLTAGDRERERKCWRVTPLVTLADRGGRNGLASYLAEIETRLIPLIVKPDRSPEGPR